MVVRHTGSIPKSSHTVNRSVLEEYVSSICLYPITLYKDTSYLFSIPKLILLIFPQLLLATSWVLWRGGHFDIVNLAYNTLIITLLLLVFSVSMGYFTQYLLNKVDDTSSSSYVYVTLISTVHLPFFIFLHGLIMLFLSKIAFFFASYVALYISNNNLLAGHSFVDSRASFIFYIVTLICYVIFFALIMGSIL